MDHTHLATLISQADPQFGSLDEGTQKEYITNLAFHLDCISVDYVNVDYDIGDLKVTDLMDAINGECPPFTNGRAMSIYGWLNGWHHYHNSKVQK